MQKGIYAFLIVLTLAVLAGFYVVFRQLSVIQQVVLNVPGNQNQPAVATSTPTSTPAAASSSTNTSTPAESAAGTVTIPTGIIFTALSSPILQPQSDVTVTVESVAKSPDGTVTVNLKAFTDKATSYTALNPSDVLMLVDLKSGNQSVVSTTGHWTSMPPQNSTTGTAIFKVDPSQSSVILQIGPQNSFNYYQFDFSTQSYKQVTLG